MALEQGEDGDRELYNSLFRSLQEPARRRILFNLLEHNPQEALMVPEEVHAGETELEDLNIELVHNHLPMLEEAGLVRWEREAGKLHKGPRFAEVRQLLAAISDHDPIVTDE